MNAVVAKTAAACTSPRRLKLLAVICGLRLGPLSIDERHLERIENVDGLFPFKPFIRLQNATPSNHVNRRRSTRCVEYGMAPRPHWKGYLKLSLVSCPISLYPAISAAERISFRQVNRQTGNRLRQQLVDSVTGEVVEAHDKGRGYEVGENQFLMVRDEELETAQQEARSRPFSTVSPRVAPAAAGAQPPKWEAPKPADTRLVETRLPDPAKREAAPPIVPPPLPPPVRIENNRTIELDRFVPREQIDPRYYNTPYYIAPRDEVGQEAFAVIRDAMARKGLVGMGRVVLANRERPTVIEPMGRGLRGITLRFAHEVRNEAEYFADIPQMMLPDEMLKITEHILETKTEDFDPAYLEDRYRTVLVEKLREKHAQITPRGAPSRPSAQNVINLMDALKRSLAAERPATRRSSPKRLPGDRAAASKPAPSRRSTSRPRRTG
jgi:non-homologous end joining protein Ku